MAGIYIHIPFCKQKCSYCSFHFSTRLTGMEEMQQALLQEIHHRQEEIAQMRVKTIYFGGGTPSLWPVGDLNDLVKAIEKHTSLNAIEEVTLECNPDDLTREYVADLKNHSRITRLSVGIQSFEDEDLRLMNRAHNAKEARSALEHIFKAGFDEVTIDLIFGLPGSNTKKWLNQLGFALQFPIGHLSCYNLTIEDKTTLKYQLQQGMISLPDDDHTIDQFYKGADFLTERGFVHYEISNYGRPGHFAVHNTSYWKNEPYIGIGPSAHSYDLYRRRWNVANNPRYINGVTQNNVFWETEELQENDQFNEYLMTSFRTMWGVEDQVIGEFSPALRESFYQHLPVEQESGNILSNNGQHVLTRKGKAIADRIISDFFYVG